MGLLIAGITGYFYTTKQCYNENAPLVTQMQTVFILTAAVCNINRVAVFGYTFHVLFNRGEQIKRRRLGCSEVQADLRF